MKVISWNCVVLNNSIRLSGTTEDGYSFVSTEVVGTKLCKNKILQVKTSFSTYTIDLQNSHCNSTVIGHYYDAANYKAAKVMCKYAVYNAVINSLEKYTEESIHNAYKLIRDKENNSEREFRRYTKDILTARATEYEKFNLQHKNFCVTLVDDRGSLKVSEIVECIKHSRSKKSLYKTVSPALCRYDSAKDITVMITEQINFCIEKGNLKYSSPQIIFINKTNQDLQPSQKVKIYNI